MIRDFIVKVLGDMEGNAILGRASGFTPTGKLNLNINKWFKYPQDLDEMVAFAEKYAEEDVYLSPLIYGDERNSDGIPVRTVKNSLYSRTVYQDSDRCHPDNFRLEPSINVVSSPGRYQNYWVLDEIVPASTAAELSHRICTAHRADGSDPSSWSANKFLRIPETTNTGHGFPEPVTWEATDKVYSVADVFNAYPEEVNSVTLPPRKVGSDPVPKPDDLPGYPETLRKVSAENLELALGEPTLGPDGNRSQWRYRLIMDLLRQGLTPEEAAVITWESPSGRKWKEEDPRGFDYLWTEVMRACAEYEAESVIPDNPTSDETVVDPDQVSLLDEMEEIVLMAYPSFVDRYLEWAHDQLELMNEPYHRANAWTVMSLCFGMYGFIPISANKKLGLNLFQMPLGGSSTGKTDAIILRKSVTDAFFRNDAEYNLGANASPEALHEVLLRRDGQVSFLQADEAARFFKEIADRKHMSGMDDLVTHFYDGFVPAIQKKSSRELSGKTAMISLTAEMFGTPEWTFRNLTSEMFLSGFLARFLWTFGNGAVETDERFDEHQADQIEAHREQDPVALAFADEFRFIRKMLGEDRRHPVLASADALKRLSANRRAMESILKSEKSWEILESPYRRLGDSLRKAMGMVTLADGSLTSDYIHALHAVRQAEQWLKGLILASRQVSSSQFQRECDVIAVWIKGFPNGATESRLYNQFNAYEPRELEVRIESLRRQGIIFSESGKYGTRWKWNTQ